MSVVGDDEFVQAPHGATIRGRRQVFCHCKSTMVCSPVLPPIFTYWLERPFQGILSWLAS
jgi:hypothetical protein